MKPSHKKHKVVGAPLEAAGNLEVRVVEDPQERERFERLLGDKHPLGSAVAVGDFLRQAVVRGDRWVALLVWGPAALKLKDRERWVGWSAAFAAERLKLVVQNRRYLLLHVKGEAPNLASQALAAACRALPGQWESRFGYRPLLAESFTDPESYAGTCYKAGGWEPVGTTEGNSRHRADYYIANQRPKRLWIKELEAGAKAKALAVPLAAEHAAALVAPVTGLLPLNKAQRLSLLEVLRRGPDPRGKNIRFRIGPVLAIVSMALLCGARQISEIARFANRLSQRQRAGLGLPLKKGTRAFRQVPGYDVFYEVLTRMDPAAFAELLSGWLAAQQGTLPGTLALDGKMIGDIIGTVSLVEVEDGSPVGIAVMDQKENTERCELKAAQDLLEATTCLEGKTLTADALHCQKQTARIITEKGGDYLLQIKGNQPDLLAYARSRPETRSPLLPISPAGTAASKNAPSGSPRPTPWAPASTPVAPSSTSAARARSRRPGTPPPKTVTTSPARSLQSAEQKIGST